MDDELRTLREMGSQLGQVIYCRVRFIVLFKRNNSRANCFAKSFIFICRRDPKSLVKPIPINNESDQNQYNEKYEAKKAKVVRHIFLIRHGQYHTNGKTDADRVLTELGML